MVHRRLGRTDLMLATIGFGALKIGRNQGVKYASDYPLPDERESVALLNAVLDLGINFIDTAPAYGLSEERIGAGLNGRRCEFAISTKVGETFEDGTSTFDFSAPAVRGSIERSLRRLRTNVLDLVFVHSNGDDLHVLRRTDVVEALQRAKRDGLARFIGFSGKTPEGAAAAIDWADALMVEYHNDDASHELVMQQAAMRGVGVVVKKGLGSGRLTPDRAIPFVLSGPSVACMVIGSLNLEHLRENVRIAETCDRAPSKSAAAHPA